MLPVSESFRLKKTLLAVDIFVLVDIILLLLKTKGRKPFGDQL